MKRVQNMMSVGHHIDREVVLKEIKNQTCRQIADIIPEDCISEHETIFPELSTYKLELIIVPPNQFTDMVKVLQKAIQYLNDSGAHDLAKEISYTWRYTTEG